MDWQEIFSVALVLFFIMDPLGNMPIFNAVLARVSTERKALISARELIFALIVLLAFLFSGNAILQFLGLEQSSLSIAGGVLLFVISLRMIFPKPGPIQEPDGADDPFIVPLAIPLVAGPSTIAMLLLLSSQQPERILEWTAALFIAWGTTTVILVASPYILRVLGERGARALERLMGMILIILATQMLLNGVRDFVKTLAA
ncbi:MAG: YhgN family NAAT transporter [Pseudomonadota bacterium]